MRIRRSREGNSASATRGNDMNENTNEKVTEETINTKEFLAKKGYDVQFGARPLKRAIQNYIEDGLCERILGGEVSLGATISIDKNPNAEELISAEADLVILKDAAYAEELRKAGIPAVCFKYTNKEELYAAVDMLGEIFGSDAKAYAVKWEEKLDSTIETISKDLAEIPETEKCNVYYVDATGAEASNENLFLTAGGGSFVEYWINTSGGNLVTSPYKDIEQIDQEEGLSLNPDTIFICGWLEYTAKDIMMSDPLWQDVPAVKNDRVFLMPTSLASYDRFSVELPLMLDYTANKMYPDYHEFGGIDELREFYKDYYGREFSDEQLENMLEGLNPDGTRMGE